MQIANFKTQPFQLSIVAKKLGIIQKVRYFITLQQKYLRHINCRHKMFANKSAANILYKVFIEMVLESYINNGIIL